MRNWKSGRICNYLMKGLLLCALVVGGWFTAGIGAKAESLTHSVEFKSEESQIVQFERADGLEQHIEVTNNTQRPMKVTFSHNVPIRNYHTELRIGGHEVASRMATAVKDANVLYAITLKDSDRVKFDQAAYTKSVAAKDYKFQMGSDRYDQLIGYIDASSYSYATAHIVEVYNYSTKNGEGSLFKRYVIKGSNNYQRSFKLTGLKPGTAKHYTVHLIRTDSSGTEYEYIDNQYWTLKSASFKTPSVSGVKFAPKKAKLIINVPSTQAGKGLSTMYVYKGNKKIKTIKSNGKTRITFVYSGSKASASSYKVKAVCAKNTKITKTSKAKKPVASKYKRQGWINPNINAITPYATATFVPWEMSYYNGKVTVTGYVVNNRIFKLKTYKVKVGVGVDNKIYASTTKTYKNVKDSTIKKVKFSFKSKKALDFVNNSPTWSVRTLKSVW